MSGTVPDQSVSPASIAELMSDIKRVAKDYRTQTGRPLGVTGEVAEYEACRLLGLCLAPVRQQGFDAVRQTAGGLRRVQVKGRVVRAGAKRRGEVPAIKLKHEWDAVVLVMLDEDLEPTVIYEDERAAIEAALSAPGSKARNERGQLALSKFRAIARQVWKRI